MASLMDKVLIDAVDDLVVGESIPALVAAARVRLRKSGRLSHSLKERLMDNLQNTIGPLYPEDIENLNNGALTAKDWVTKRANTYVGE